MYRRSLVVVVCLCALWAAACQDTGLAPAPVHRDLAAAEADMAVGDLGAPDLEPIDMAVTPVDIAMIRDIAGCAGGYLNSVDPGACPLSCSPLVESVKDEGAIHIPFCSPISYAHDPPASGNHWPWPADWGVHREVVPREWWVHNLEHQGIVLLYNCPYSKDGGAKPPDMAGAPLGTCVMDGGLPQPPGPVDDCAAEIAALVGLYTKHPVDNWWDLIFETRILITPDPYLKTRFAALAWDWAYTSNQLDVSALQCFIDARYGRGPEPAP